MRHNPVSVTLHRRVTLPRLTWRYLVLKDPACCGCRIPQAGRMSSVAPRPNLVAFQHMLTSEQQAEALEVITSSRPCCATFRRATPPDCWLCRRVSGASGPLRLAALRTSKTRPDFGRSAICHALRSPSVTSTGPPRVRPNLCSHCTPDRCNDCTVHAPLSTCLQRLRRPASGQPRCR